MIRLLVLALLVNACHSRHDPPRAASPAAADTARGIVAVVGSDRNTQVVLKLEPTAPYLTLTGPQTDALRRTMGADVWVTGTRKDNSLEVSSFVVRTVDGVPALDGRVAADGDKLYLVTPEGVRRLIVHPPPPLRSHIGARVWITGALDRDPVAFGLIEDAR